MSLPFTWLDVFTSSPLAGNQLVVVHDADDLDEATMLAFARETRMSETTFVQAASEPGATYRNRIFDPRGELPLAGHPTLGTAVAIAARSGERRASYVQQTPAGLQPVDVELRDGGAARASMLQEPAEHGAEVERVEVAAAAGLAAGDLHPELSPQAVSTGYRHLLAMVRDAAALERCDPRLDLLDPLLEGLGCGVLSLAAVDQAAGSARVRAFFPAFGAVHEDPATGSAAGALCAYLDRHCGLKAVDIEQGVAMGRPSRLLAAIDGDRVRVSGEVVVLATGQLRL